MSEDATTYNGWKNYETWAVGLFLDGNYTGEGTYRDVLELVERYATQGTSVYHLADALEEYAHTEVLGDDPPASLATDLLGAALSEVDWRELAESKLSEVAEVRS